MGARIALGAGAGALSGYLNFDPKNTTESNLTNAAVGTVAGGSLGAALPPVMRGVIQGAQKLVTPWAARGGHLLKQYPQV